MYIIMNKKRNNIKYVCVSNTSDNTFNEIHSYLVHGDQHGESLMHVILRKPLSYHALI